MHKEDYLKQQYDRMGQVLGYMLAKLLKLKNNPEISYQLNDLLVEFEDSTSINLDQLVALSNEEFFNCLPEFDVKNEHYENFANILMETGLLHENLNLKLSYFQKSKLLFEMYLTNSITYSVNASIKLNELNRLIQLYGI
ncbi:MAG: hypothetical protein ACK5QC_03230 [Bacteroidota bacterium]|jgi:hypothetical protein|nr:hypothetical protein [Bacteroidota bacterium]MCA6445307.1 hypothetical protein [Bacteroidota bacterium]